MTHQKPTAEELQANIDKSTKELEKLENPTPNPTPSPTPVAQPPVPNPQPEPPKTETPTPQDPPKPENQPKDGDQPKQGEPQQPKPATTPEPSKQPEGEEYWRKRHTESTREAQILYAQNKKKDEAISAANQLPEPTDEDLKVEAVKQGFNYEDMSPVEKSLFKKSIHNDRKLAKITEVSQEGKDIEEWHGKVDTFIGDPKTLIKYTALEGKQEAFREFASKPTRRGTDFADLISAFLYESDQAKPNNKGKQMFETPSGGPNDNPKPKIEKLTPAQGEQLRQTDYKAWVAAVKANRISDGTEEE